MKDLNMTKILVMVAGILTLFIGNPIVVYAHCDTLDGPVVIDAKAALTQGDVTPVLKWVKSQDEEEIRTVFNETLAERKKGEDAQQSADTHFFETLVRVHRASEGAPYTGLKPAGSVPPPIAAADKSIVNGSVDDLATAISTHVAEGMHRRFQHLLETKEHVDESVDAGREYVRAYVEFVHYIEGIHNIVAGNAHHHEE